MPAESSALPAPLIVTAPPTDARPARWPWLAVGGLVVLALALRLGCLFYVLGADFVWHDADAYLAKGARLVESGQFRWTYDAVAYPWGGRVYALPPLFSIYLDVYKVAVHLLRDRFVLEAFTLHNVAPVAC